ncbi:hypothetical protein STEG23_009279 [Scotinomys teguina]
MEYYAAEKNNDIMKFASKWMELENVILSKLVYMVYYIDRLSYVEPSLHLWDKAYLIMVHNVFDVFLDHYISIFISNFIDLNARSLSFALSFIISWCLFLLGDFDSSHSRVFSFHLVDLSVGWNLPSSAFYKVGFVDSWYSSPSSIPIIHMLDLFMVSQISWTFCFMTFLDLVFSLTDESISSIFCIDVGPFLPWIMGQGLLGASGTSWSNDVWGAPGFFWSDGIWELLGYKE